MHWVEFYSEIIGGVQIIFSINLFTILFIVYFIFEYLLYISVFAEYLYRPKTNSNIRIFTLNYIT